MVRKITRKTLKVRPNGRSSDFIPPFFGQGCLYTCAYCYMKRNVPNGLSVPTNTDDILNTIDQHVMSLDWKKKPNQVDETYYTYDISCDEDFILHHKHHEWKKIWEFFINHERAKATLATKGNVPKAMIDYNTKKKIRIRFSLIPEKYRKILEPNTPTIEDRIKQAAEMHLKGHEIHLNFSPVVITSTMINDYIDLLNMVNDYLGDIHNNTIKSEVIFLTHNEKMHHRNLENDRFDAEAILWKPKIQESKISQNGQKNIRYQYQLKERGINVFKSLMNDHIPWCEIRYIF